MEVFPEAVCSAVVFVGDVVAALVGVAFAVAASVLVEARSLRAPVELLLV